VAAIDGRAVHAYHVEGVGGGHIPDLIGIVSQPNVVCSSTTPTIPYGRWTAAEHLEMILAVHGGSVGDPVDVAAARERIHPATMAAEGPLHELGAISIINSDSQGMGRIGETIRRTWQLAHAMKAWRASPEGQGWPQAPGIERLAQSPPRGPGHDGADDTDRVLRYLAKYTAEPARVHGLEQEVGSLAPGRLADIVLWRPALFGVHPELVLKAGCFAWGALGEGNATIESCEPRRYGPHWGALGRAAAGLSVTFVSEAALAAGIWQSLGSRRRFAAVRGCREITKGRLVANRASPQIEIDTGDGTVRLDARTLAARPVAEVPLSRKYLLG
jgi:urease subunit alpha